jgi:hypothetical protein
MVDLRSKRRVDARKRIASGYAARSGGENLPVIRFYSGRFSGTVSR